MLPTVTPSELQDMALLSFQTHQPLLVVGAPGIGKSELVNQIRIISNMDMILTHPVVSDPLDAKGLPHAYQDPITQELLADFIPYGDLRFAMKATRPTIWFIDDLGQAPPTVQAALMQLLLSREVNGKRISDHIYFIAATNRRGDKAGVSGILEPVKSRFGLIVELVPDISDWSKWAYKNKVYSSIIAYLKSNPKRLLDFKPSNDMEQSPSPRTWAMLSKNLNNFSGSPKLRSKIIQATIGEAESIPFQQFENLPLPDIDELIRYPHLYTASKNNSTVFAICSGVATRTTIKNIANIYELSKRLPKQFSSMLLQDCKTCCPDVLLTETFLNWSENILPGYMNN